MVVLKANTYSTIIRRHTVYIYAG